MYLIGSTKLITAMFFSVFKLGHFGSLNREFGIIRGYILGFTLCVTNLTHGKRIKIKASLH